MPEPTPIPAPTPAATAPTPAPIPAPAPAPRRKKARGWDAPIISIYSGSLMLVALVFAYLTGNTNLMLTLAGIIATNMTTIVNYHFGSSAGSQAKDETISGQLPAPPVQVQPTPQP